MEKSLVTTRNIAAILSLLLIIVGIIGMTQSYDQSNALLLLGLFVFVTVVIPLYIFSAKNMEKLRDGIIRSAEKQQRSRRRKVLS
jgi:Zn-dependent membrane protease YugP